MRNIFLFVVSLLAICATGVAYAVDAACVGKCMGNGFTFNNCQQQCGGEPQTGMNNTYENVMNAAASQQQKMRQMAQPSNAPDYLKQQCYVDHNPVACRDVMRMDQR